MLELTSRYYPDVSNSRLKMQLCKTIVEQIRSEGGRFVVQWKGKWYEVMEKEAIAKVEQQFRNRKNKAPKTTGSTRSITRTRSTTPTARISEPNLHMPLLSSTNPQSLAFSYLHSETNTFGSTRPTAAASVSEANLNFPYTPSSNHQICAIQSLQSAMLSVLNEIDSIPPAGHSRPSRAEREDQLLKDERVRRATLEMAYSLPLGRNNVVSPSIASGPAAPAVRAPSAASICLVAANPEFHTSSSHSSVISSQTDASFGSFGLYEV
ncbi:unnamed protein product [Cylindrotheca closterium]|nr:unnamed protein product [Cylindrotheca closterium]